MKKLLILSLFLLAVSTLLAQKRLSVTVRAGQNIMNVLSPAEIFLYPTFTKGTVFFKDGATISTTINYNRVVDEMHFIDPNGDTLAVDNERSLKYIVVDADTFFYHQGFIRLISTGDVVKLGIRDRWRMIDTRQFGGYNSTNNSDHLYSFAGMRQGGRLYDLTVSQDMTLEAAESYYFADGYDNFQMAGKASLLNLLPKQEGVIRKYLKENKVAFGRKEDLYKLVQSLNRKGF